jgi:hypothetical protein
MTDPNFCAQRIAMQLFRKPLPRFDLNSINPYLSKTYTKEQLDMRRKAEILKYSANRSSTQTNSLTKKERFALLSRGSYVQPNQQVLSRGAQDCPADDAIPTPTTASDVPGPVMYLYNDETVPLYNYSSFGLRAYPDYVPTNSDNWQLVSPPDVALNYDAPPETNYLVIYNTVDKPAFYTYKITIPIGILVSGTSTATSGPITATITNVRLTAYYNDSLYATYNYDPDMVGGFSITGTGVFSAKRFLGNAVFPNVRLYASPTFIYSFKCRVTLTAPSGVWNIVAVANISKNETSGPISIAGAAESFNTGSAVEIVSLT